MAAQVEGPTLHTLAVNVLWDSNAGAGSGAAVCTDAVHKCTSLLATLTEPAAGLHCGAPQATVASESTSPALPGWQQLHARCLHDLSDAAAPAAAHSATGNGAASNGTVPGVAAAPEELRKIVLARRTELLLEGPVHGLQLLDVLQHSSPTSYQLALILPDGNTFVASTPERLFAREGVRVASEAIAGAALLSHLRHYRARWRCSLCTAHWLHIRVSGSWRARFPDCRAATDSAAVHAFVRAASAHSAICRSNVARACLAPRQSTHQPSEQQSVCAGTRARGPKLSDQDAQLSHDLLHAGKVCCKLVKEQRAGARQHAIKLLHTRLAIRCAATVC